MINNSYLNNIGMDFDLIEKSSSTNWAIKTTVVFGPNTKAYTETNLLITLFSPCLKAQMDNLLVADSVHGYCSI